MSNHHLYLRSLYLPWQAYCDLPGTRVRGDFLKGMAKNAEKFVILLDIDKVISNVEPEAAVPLREL